MAILRAKGGTLKVSISSTYTAIEAQTAWKGPSASMEMIESTGITDTSATFEPTLVDNGEATVKYWYDPAATAQAYLRTQLNSPPSSADAFKVYKADNTTALHTFSGYVRAIELSENTARTLHEATATIKVTGALT